MIRDLFAEICRAKLAGRPVAAEECTHRILAHSLVGNGGQAIFQLRKKIRSKHKKNCWSNGLLAAHMKRLYGWLENRETSSKNMIGIRTGQSLVSAHDTCRIELRSIRLQERSRAGPVKQCRISYTLVSHWQGYALSITQRHGIRHWKRYRYKEPI